MHQEFNLPADNDFSRSFNIQSRKEQITRDIAGQYAALHFINEGYFGSSDLLKDGDTSDESISSEQIDLSSMKILGYIPPEELSEEYDTDSLLNTKAQQTKVCGADEVGSSVVIFEINGNKYCFCFETRMDHFSIPLTEKRFHWWSSLRIPFLMILPMTFTLTARRNGMN